VFLAKSAPEIISAESCPSFQQASPTLPRVQPKENALRQVHVPARAEPAGIQAEAMKKSELLKIFAELDFHPGKQLGQNFLVDANLLEFIVRTGAPTSGETVLEVGPGFGVLTRALLATGAKVTAIEFDHRICAYLRDNISDPNFKLVQGDACKVDIEEAVGDADDFRCIANLPYSVSSVFIARLLEMENPPLSMLFMLQKEMGLRLAAKPGIKNYGSLSVRSQSVYDVELLRSVPPQVFFPRPDVGSALVAFKRKCIFPAVDIRIKLAWLSKIAFSKRRKMMFKTLAQACDASRLEEVYAAFNLTKDLRPEAVSSDTFVDMARMLLDS